MRNILHIVTVDTPLGCAEWLALFKEAPHGLFK